MNTTTKDTAKAIRKDLKQNFPNTKFSVTSDVGIVNISYTLGDKIKGNAISDITNKYKYMVGGSIDDSCDYSNRNNDLPQCHYIIVHSKTKTTGFKDCDCKYKIMYCCGRSIEIHDENCHILNEEQC